jgi:hypothetical protein
MARKNSLVENINRRKRAGKSRPKSRSSVSKKAYTDMQRGWPSKGKSAGKKRSAKKGAAKKRTAKKSSGRRKSTKKTRSTKR